MVLRCLDEEEDVEDIVQHKNAYTTHPFNVFAYN